MLDFIELLVTYPTEGVFLFFAFETVGVLDLVDPCLTPRLWGSFPVKTIQRRTDFLVLFRRQAVVLGFQTEDVTTTGVAFSHQPTMISRRLLLA